MNKEDSISIKLLESTTNLRRLASKTLGFELSADKANQICTCLQQGRLFYEAAENAPWEIKPLLVYYGLVAFSTAVTLVRTKSKLEMLPQSHGLSDNSKNDTNMENLIVKVEEKRGTFHEMNEVFRCLERLILRLDYLTTVKLPCPGSTSTELTNKTMTLKEIMARIPGLEDTYHDTFGEEPSVIGCSHFSVQEQGGKKRGEFWVHAYKHTSLTDLASFKAFIEHLRAKFTFLKKWRPIHLQATGIIFANIPPIKGDEFSEDLWRKTEYDYRSNAAIGEGGKTEPSGFLRACEPVAGGLTENTAIIQAFDGVHINEFALHYLGMFSLSSLVRYRPNIWANAISRRAIGDKPVDDRALALIENFVELSLTVVPRTVLAGIREAA